LPRGKYYLVNAECMKDERGTTIVASQEYWHLDNINVSGA